MPFGDDLVIHLSGRLATSTSDVEYGRTCAFQVRPDGRVPSPHIYFSRTVKFGSLSTTPLARIAGSAITFTDGSGLLVGGTTPDTFDPIVQVERFDPLTGEYRVLHDVQPRTGSVAALLVSDADSRIAVIGGVDIRSNTGATFYELIRPDRAATREPEVIDDAQMARVGLTATTLVSGDIVVIGGKDAGLMGTASNKVAIMSNKTGTPVVTMSRAILANARSGHTATRLADDVGAPVLVAGGLDDAGMPVAAAELYKPLSDSFSANFNRAMLHPRSHHQAVRLTDGSVLFIGGVDAAGMPIKELERFSLDAGFEPAGVMPDSAGLIDVTATVLPDGRVLLAGGRFVVGGAPTSNAFIASLDPVDQSVDVVPTDRLAVPRAGHQAMILCDGTVLVSGGTPDQTVYERYNPPATDRR